jgi:hypothetical protein
MDQFLALDNLWKCGRQSVDDVSLSAGMQAADDFRVVTAVAERAATDLKGLNGLLELLCGLRLFLEITMDLASLVVLVPGEKVRRNGVRPATQHALLVHGIKVARRIFGIWQSNRRRWRILALFKIRRGANPSAASPRPPEICFPPRPEHCFPPRFVLHERHPTGDLPATIPRNNYCRPIIKEESQ